MIADVAAPRSAALEEGVALLKAGSVALKYGRHGKPHACIFVLSADERSLSWEAQSAVDRLGRSATAGLGRRATRR